MTITNATPEDITEIFRLYQIASEFQRTKKTVVVWPNFERSLVETELTEKRQFKLLIKDQVACVWAVTFTDEQIWEERSLDAAVYIHRIAINPKFRGQNFIKVIVGWAKDFAQSKRKQYVRLDTLGNNTKLIKHYTNAGFSFLGMFDLKNTDALPVHYQEAPVCLFEMDLRA